MTVYMYSYILIFLFGRSGIWTVFQEASGFLPGRGFLSYLLPGLLTDLTYGAQIHYLRGYVQNYLRRSLTESPSSLNLTLRLGPPRQESISFTKKSSKGIVCFYGDSQNHEFSPGEGPWQVDPNQAADMYFFEESDDCFPSGQLPGILLGTFQDPCKTTAAMYASGTPSGNLPGASRTAVELKRASQPSGQLPVSF